MKPSLLRLLALLASHLRFVTKITGLRYGTIKAAQLGRKAVTFLLRFLLVVSHRLTPINISITIIILGAAYQQVEAHLITEGGTYDLVACPSGYAIEVQPAHYVPCESIEHYWALELAGKRKLSMEMKAPHRVNINLNKENSLWK